jgi:hypothetical protein
VKKGGARLLGRAAVRPFYKIINDLKFRLHPVQQEAISPLTSEAPRRGPVFVLEAKKVNGSGRLGPEPLP